MPLEAALIQRAAVLKKLRMSDALFAALTRSSAVFVLILLGAVFVSLIIGGWPAAKEFGFGFLTSQSWNPVTEKFGGLAPIYGTVFDLRDRPRGGRAGGTRHRRVPHGNLPAVAAAAHWHRHRALAGIPSIIYGIWGLFVFAPFLQRTVQPFLIDAFANVPVLNSLFAGPPYGIGMLTASFILAIMVLPFITAVSRDVFQHSPPMLKEAAYGIGCTRWEVVRSVVLPTPASRRRHRRHHARARRALAAKPWP